MSDNGPGFTPQQLEELNKAMPREENGRHVGLANALRRFQLLYGDGLAVAFASGREGGAKSSCSYRCRQSQRGMRKMKLLIVDDQMSVVEGLKRASIGRP